MKVIILVLTYNTFLKYQIIKINQLKKSQFLFATAEDLKSLKLSANFLIQVN